MREVQKPSFYEFFAGGGMVRAGLGVGWNCQFANDIDQKKALTYQENWGAGGEMAVGDIGALSAADLPGDVDLAWASFPCQDLSLAGAGAGLGGQRSGAFYPFWSLMRALHDQDRAPKVVVLENVVGTLTSHDGNDFRVICRTYVEAGYRFGALAINADGFVPQSRPRLFMIGLRKDLGINQAIKSAGPTAPYHTPAVQRAIASLPALVQQDLVWWNLPTPPSRNTVFADLIEDQPEGVAWHTAAETTRLLAMMSPVNSAKVDVAKQSGQRMVGGVYKRTRRNPNGDRIQRAEVRFDDVAGCLRTPAGGSSRQTILLVDGGQVRSRLISARETARLMGLEDSYRLPKSYNAAYHLTGDGVVVPVVRHLAHHIIEPLLGLDSAGTNDAAA
jgi:DNA (cytosine-5)-methyltransferase 1